MMLDSPRTSSILQPLVEKAESATATSTRVESSTTIVAKTESSGATVEKIDSLATTMAKTKSSEETTT